MLPQEHLGQVGLAALQLCLRHGEGVGGGSDGSGTRWQPVLSRWPTQHSAAAHGSAGQRELADNSLAVLTPAGAWRIRFPSHLGDAACCCPAVPGCSLGQAGGADGFQLSPA